MAEKLYSYADKQVMDEVGSGGGGASSSTLAIHEVENRTLDKTWKQIHDHIANGGMAVIIGADQPENEMYDRLSDVITVQHVTYGGFSEYTIVSYIGDFTASDENDYPRVVS